jgi:large subunit ribosomal protein L23
MAIFTKKPEDKDEVKYEVTTPAASGGKTPSVRIPTVLVQPRISEKAGRLASMNKYVFKVQTSANKVEIRKAVESFYKVHVTRINIINNQGKHRTYGRTSGKTSDFKKAVVTLKKGDKIEGATETV